MSLEGKIALVTGASRGIGAAILETLGKQGVTVMGTATTQAGADSITEELVAKNISGRGYVMDIACSESVANALAKMREDFGDCAILVNNAGITRDNLMLRMKPEEWDAVINTNLTSVFRLVRECLKSMVKARWGRIISIGSVTGLSGNPGQANYGAAKAGIIGFSKSLAQEIASRGVTVNVVAPGLTETRMSEELTEEQRQALIQLIPVKRLGQPSEIAAAVAFLASPEAAYITGETLNVSGGMYMQ